RDVLSCLDAHTGKERWRVDFAKRYHTPVPPYGFVSSPLVDGDDLYVQAAAALVKLDKRTGAVLWRVLPYASSPNGTALSSPVLVGRYAYLHLRNQRLTCLDLETGEACWTTRRTFGRYWSMATHGDLILALDQRGTLYLIRANPEKFELLDERKVSDEET